MTSRADHIHFAWIDRVSFGCSVYQMATRIAITYGPIPSISRVRATTIRYTFCSLRDSAFDHRPSPYCPTQLVFFNLPPTIRFPLLAVHPGPSSSHNRFFRVLASVLAPDNSSSRPLGQRSSFPAYQFLTTDWFSRKYSSLMNTVSFHSFLNRMSVFCIGSRCLSLEPAFPTFFSPPTSLAASSFILPSLREIILPNLLTFINDAV